MSLQTEINRLTQAKENLKTSINSKGGNLTNESISSYYKAVDLLSAKPKLQVVTVTPAASAKVVTPDSGYDGLSKVTVNGDANLVPDNIKEGVSIFGVKGNNAGGLLELLNLKWIMGSDGEIQYTNISGESITLPLSYSNNLVSIDDIDFKKNIVLDTYKSDFQSGITITISFLNKTFSLDFIDKSLGAIEK